MQVREEVSQILPQQWNEVDIWVVTWKVVERALKNPNAKVTYLILAVEPRHPIFQMSSHVSTRDKVEKY